MNISGSILNQFPSNIRPAVINFANSIHEIDSDYIIFMARKALRLYDLLLLAEFPPATVPIFSHHIIDQNLDFLKGKKVTLIDDTLIVGSTLRRTKAELLRAGIREVSTTVLCIDTEWSNSDIFEPDKHFASLTSQEMLTFCSTEVSAFSANGVPYISDYPFTTLKRFTTMQLELFLSGTDWSSHPVNIDSDSVFTSLAHTFLPSANFLENLLIRYNLDLVAITEIIKVRMYVRKDSNGGLYCKFVPIVSLRPLRYNEIDLLLEKVFQIEPIAKLNINNSLISKTSKVRFLQHLLSTIIYELFSDSMSPLLQRGKMPPIDYVEMNRHLVGKSANAIKVIANSTDKLCILQSIFHPTRVSKQSTLPTAIASSMTRHVLDAITPYKATDRIFEARFFLSDLMRVFVDFYHKIEIPARIEIDKFSKLSPDQFDKLENVNRLKIGVTWTALLETITKQKTSWEQKQFLSIYLDRLVDMGIAVPALCDEDNQLYRVYRHGEDVLIGEQEYAMCYLACQGYIESTKCDFINRIPTEKLLTLMLKIGMKMNQVEEIHGSHSFTEWARIGYHLHGAVVYMEPSNKNSYASGTENWLTTRLIQQNVLKHKNLKYTLGEEPQASMRSSNSADFANQFGYLLGELTSGGDKDPILKSNDLILLASIPAPPETLSALSAEIFVFQRYFHKNIQSELKNYECQNIETTKKLLKKIKSDKSYAALNSARMKYQGFKTNKLKTIVEKCEDYYSTKENDRMSAKVWKQYMNALFQNSSDDESEEIQNHIELIGTIISDLSIAIYNIELSLSSILAGSGDKRKITDHKNTCKKITKFYNDFASPFLQYSHDKNLHKRLKTAVLKNEIISLPDIAFKYSLETIFTHAKNFKSEAVLANEYAFHFDKLKDSIRYQDFVWYDIVSSKEDKRSDEHEKYRHTVALFKEKLNRITQELQRVAIVKKCIVRPHRNHPDDDDDSASIFFANSAANHFAQIYICKLLECAKLFNMQLKICILPANFMGTHPTSLKNTGRINALVFFEGFSMVRPQLENWVKEEDSTYTKNSYLYVGASYEKRPYEDIVPAAKIHKTAQEIDFNLAGCDYVVPFTSYIIDPS